MLLFSFVRPKKSISALPVQEQNFVPACLCPWSFLSGTSLSLLLQKGLGAYAGSRPKENIKRKRRLLDVRPPPVFGESVIVRCDWPFWSSQHWGFTLKRINLLLVLPSELTFSFFPWSYQSLKLDLPDRNCQAFWIPVSLKHSQMLDMSLPNLTHPRGQRETSEKRDNSESRNKSCQTVEFYYSNEGYLTGINEPLRTFSCAHTLRKITSRGKREQQKKPCLKGFCYVFTFIT